LIASVASDTPIFVATSSAHLPADFKDSANFPESFASAKDGMESLRVNRELSARRDAAAPWHKDRTGVAVCAGFASPLSKFFQFESGII